MSTVNNMTQSGIPSGSATDQLHRDKIRTRTHATKISAHHRIDDIEMSVGS